MKLSGLLNLFVFFTSQSKDRETFVMCLSHQKTSICTLKFKFPSVKIKYQAMGDGKQNSFVIGQICGQSACHVQSSRLKKSGSVELITQDAVTRL